MSSVIYQSHCLHVECWVIVLCLCNFDSWCGESRGQSRILPVGLGREPQSQTVIKHSTFSFYLQIECKNNSPRWHLSQNRWQLPAQSLSHTYIFKIHTPIYTHTHFRTRLCPPKTSSVIRAHTHTFENRRLFSRFPISARLKGLTSTLPSLKVSFTE